MYKVKVYFPRGDFDQSILGLSCFFWPKAKKATVYLLPESVSGYIGEIAKYDKMRCFIELKNAREIISSFGQIAYEGILDEGKESYECDQIKVRVFF